MAAKIRNTLVLCRAAQAPVWHLSKVAGGEIAAYLNSFDRVWDTAKPLPEE